MIYYSYSEDTKEYIGKGICQIDPLESKNKGEKVYLLPKNATFTEPLPEKEKNVIIWNDSSWEYIEDNRGTEYWLPEDTWQSTAHEMKELGPLPENAIFERPKKSLYILKDEKIKYAESLFISSISKITPYYSSDEKDTFYKQESQAKYYLTEKEAGREPEQEKIVFIKNLAESRGVSLEELVEKINIKVTAFEALSSKLLGLKQKVEDLVSVAQTEEEVNAIDVDNIFAELLSYIENSLKG